MSALPSGLPEHIDDEEPLARFLTSSGQFSATKGVVKGAAFLPKEGETSVSRHGAEPLESLRELGKPAAGERPLYGAAIVQAADVRMASLDASADEPPPRHAILTNWPVGSGDPELLRSKHKDIAHLIASRAVLIRFAL